MPVQPASSFNPTRVRLELANSEHTIVRKKASTPQGCVWNVYRYRLAVKRPRASTPQGCVWNLVTENNRHVFEALQPHKGTTGISTRFGLSLSTRVRLELVVLAILYIVVQLQPHKGASGTGRIWRRVIV